MRNLVLLFIVPFSLFASSIVSPSDILSELSCSINQIPKWNGSVWACAVDSGGGGVTINSTSITSGTSGRLLYDNAGTIGEILASSLAVSSANYVYDTSGTPVLSVDGVNRSLKNSSEYVTVDWQNNTLKDALGALAQDFNARVLYAINGTTELINYSHTVNAAYISFATSKVSFFNDAAYFDNSGALTVNGVTSASATISANQLTATSAADLPHFYTSGSGISFFGVSPQQAQVNTGITAASFTANTSGIADDSATFGGYTLGQVVAALKAYGLLQ